MCSETRTAQGGDAFETRVSSLSDALCPTVHLSQCSQHEISRTSPKFLCVYLLACNIHLALKTCFLRPTSKFFLM